MRCFQPNEDWITLCSEAAFPGGATNVIDTSVIPMMFEFSAAAPLGQRVGCYGLAYKLKITGGNLALIDCTLDRVPVDPVNAVAVATDWPLAQITLNTDGVTTYWYHGVVKSIDVGPGVLLRTTRGDANVDHLAVSIWGRRFQGVN